jgi:plastocyanin
MKNKLLLKLGIIAIMFITVAKANSATHLVTVQNFSLTPDVVNAVVGDTIKWVWLNGNHSSTSGTIPIDASPWDVNLNSSNTSYLYVLEFPGDYYYFCRLHPEVEVGIIYVSAITPVKPLTEAGVNSKLKQNYPNPFNPSTKIGFNNPKQGFVSLKVYDLSGREVSTLLNETLKPGYYEIEFNGNKLASGTYFYFIQTSEFTEIKKMSLIK